MGEQVKVFAYWLHSSDLNHWQGWNCSAGSQRFYIDKKFDVYSGECKNNHLGNMFISWSLKHDTVCTRQTCSPNTDDLITTKYRPE